MMSAAVAARPTAPSSGNGVINTKASDADSTTTTGHAIDRSTEMLSCARQALQMGQDRHRRLVARQERQWQQQQQAAADGHNIAMPSNAIEDDDDDDGSPTLPDELLSVQPNSLNLYSPATGSLQDTYNNSNNNIENENDNDAAMVSDALRLLSSLDGTTSTLSSLVRRRGHTNDPTSRINSTIVQFDEMAKELVELVEHIKVLGTSPVDYVTSRGRIRGSGSSSSRTKKMSKQRQKHYENVARDLSSMADERVSKFKKMLQVRERVIRDQNERRRMLNPTTTAAAAVGSSSTATSGSASSGSGGSGERAPNSGGIAATLAAKNTLAAGAKGGVSQLSSPLFTVPAGGGGGGGSVVRPRPPPPPAPAAAAARAGAASTVHASNGGSGTGSGLTPAAASAGSRNGYPPTVTSSAAANGRQGGGAGTGYYGAYGGYDSAYGGAAAGVGMRRRPNAPPAGVGGRVGSTSAVGGYGGGYGGYGGGQYPRQQNNYRPYDPSMGDDSKKTDGDDDAAAVQSSIQTRRARRETAARLEQARNAERTLANLGTVFSKMADLVVSQGETIEKVEDDVEAARVDVNAGHDEIQKLYGITKGNRGLILKVFGILIFFIIFMRFY